MTQIIWKTPVPSTAFFQGVNFTMLLGRKVSLEYSYEDKDDSLIVFEKIIFGGVEGFKCTYYNACSLEMIDAYDKVVSLENSDWLNGIQNNLTKSEISPLNLKHLRIYFDDGPCYEFICKSFEIVNEKQKNNFENLNSPIE
jgi:hypothetical protein